MTQEITDTVCQGVAMGMTFELSAQLAGVSCRTFYRWMKRGEDEEEGGTFWQFRHAVKRAESEGALNALATINRAASDGSWQAAAWLLERRHKYRRDAPAQRDVVELESLQEEAQTPEQIIDAISELPEAMLLAALNRHSAAGNK